MSDMRCVEVQGTTTVKLDRIEVKQGSWFQFAVRTFKYDEQTQYAVYEVTYTEDGELTLRGDKPITFESWEDFENGMKGIAK